MVFEDYYSKKPRNCNVFEKFVWFALLLLCYKTRNFEKNETRFLEKKISRSRFSIFSRDEKMINTNCVGSKTEATLQNKNTKAALQKNP